jgi:hypothetical protein
VHDILPVGGAALAVFYASRALGLNDVWGANLGVLVGFLVLLFRWERRFQDSDRKP